MSRTDLDYEISRRNLEGYADPTAYQALKHLQRAEFGYRPLVYICSPYSGDIEANTEVARDMCRAAVTACKIPLTQVSTNSG